MARIIAYFIGGASIGLSFGFVFSAFLNVTGLGDIVIGSIIGALIATVVAADMNRYAILERPFVTEPENDALSGAANQDLPGYPLSDTARARVIPWVRSKLERWL